MGDIPSTGMFAQQEEDAEFVSLDVREHDEWNTVLESDIRARGLSGRACDKDVAAVFAACEKEGGAHAGILLEARDGRTFWSGGLAAHSPIRRLAERLVPGV